MTTLKISTSSFNNSKNSWGARVLHWFFHEVWINLAPMSFLNCLENKLKCWRFFSRGGDVVYQDFSPLCRLYFLRIERRNIFRMKWRRNKHLLKLLFRNGIATNQISTLHKSSSPKPHLLSRVEKKRCISDITMTYLQL